MDEVRALLAAGENANEVDDKGNTPLHIAAEVGKPEAVPMLINAGAAVDAENRDGKTPMYVAAERWRPEICALLVGLGADITEDKYPDFAAFECTRINKIIKMSQGNRTMVVVWLLGEAAPPYKGMVARTLPWIFARRKARLARWRRATDAQRDAGYIFWLARDGRPLDLERRLVLGGRAGGLERKGDLSDGEGGTKLATPLEAARAGGHTECVYLLEDAARKVAPPG